MRPTSRGTTGVALLAAALLAAPPAAEAGVVAPGLARELAARGPEGEVSVIVELAGRLDPGPFAVRDRRLRDNRLLKLLKRAKSGSSCLP